MIIKASQRGFARNLANHLASTNDNDHVTLMEIRGVIGQSIHAALLEMEAISQGTRCRKPFFSVSFNPPPNVDVSHKAFEQAFDALEESLGLQGQPRIAVFHEKSARRHAHVVWLRVQIDAMKAIRMSHFKRKCVELSRLLYLRHGWDMPAGFKDSRLKDPFGLSTAEWQQNLRQNIDPKEIKALCQAAWKQSASLLEFQKELEEKGLFLASGDRRVFVVVDRACKVYSLSRYGGIASRALNERFAKPDLLHSVQVIKKKIRLIYNRSAREAIAMQEVQQVSELANLTLTKRELIEVQRGERTAWILKNNSDMFSAAFRVLAGISKSLSQQFAKVSGIHLMRGRRERNKRQDKIETSNETWEGMVLRQNHESRKIQNHINAIRTKHRDERTALAKQIVAERRGELTSINKSSKTEFTEKTSSDIRLGETLESYRGKRIVDRKGRKSVKRYMYRTAKKRKAKRVSRVDAALLKRKRNSPRFRWFLDKQVQTPECQQPFNQVAGEAACEATPLRQKRGLVPRAE